MAGQRPVQPAERVSEGVAWKIRRVDRHEPFATRTASQLVGDAAESLVAARLEKAGWRILGRNVHVGRRELDLVAIDVGPPAALVVVEVRCRSGRAFGLAEETVDHRKRRRLREAMYELLGRGRLPSGAALPRLPVRVDLVVVEPRPLWLDVQIRHHRGVF
jgi:putative endonuclease